VTFETSLGNAAAVLARTNPPTPEDIRRAQINTAVEAMEHDWTDRLVEVLAMLGIGSRS